MKHLFIKVTGRVQGVFFRQKTLEEAVRLGLNGTVQNMPDGSVEIHGEGSEEKLEEFIKWCGAGPNNAIVEEVKSEERSLENYKDFSII